MNKLNLLRTKLGLISGAISARDLTHGHGSIPHWDSVEFGIFALQGAVSIHPKGGPPGIHLVILLVVSERARSRRSPVKVV